MSRPASSRRGRTDDAVERFELAKRVEYFGAIDCQRVAHEPSEADIDAAGFFRECVRESLEKIGTRRARPRQLATVPVLVLLNFLAAKPLLQVRRFRLDCSRNLRPILRVRLNDRPSVDAHTRD